MSKPVVSDHDRDYFRRLGEFKAESHRAAIERHQRLSPNDRLVVSALLTRRLRDHLQWNRREEAPEKFYERARAVGQYRS